jgi:hypothetical protein
MRSYLFVGGPADGAWIKLPDTHAGKLMWSVPLKPKLEVKLKPDLPPPTATYRPIPVRCGPEVAIVYALDGMNTGAILAKLISRYGHV